MPWMPAYTYTINIAVPNLLNMISMHTTELKLCNMLQSMVLRLRALRMVRSHYMYANISAKTKSNSKIFYYDNQLYKKDLIDEKTAAFW
jgi:hypothetical protein